TRTSSTQEAHWRGKPLLWRVAPVQNVSTVPFGRHEMSEQMIRQIHLPRLTRLLNVPRGPNWLLDQYQSSCIELRQYIACCPRDINVCLLGQGSDIRVYFDNFGARRRGRNW